jgi:hypothetical protein
MWTALESSTLPKSKRNPCSKLLSVVCTDWIRVFGRKTTVFDRMFVAVEVHEEPTTHTVMIEKLKRWIKSHGRHPREQAKKEELRRLLFGPDR